MTALLDLEYLTAHARDQQTAAHRAAYTDRCPRCPHDWHGLACTAKFPSPCTCSSAFEDKA